MILTLTLHVNSKSQRSIFSLSEYISHFIFFNVHFLSLLINVKVCEEIDLQIFKKYRIQHRMQCWMPWSSPPIFKGFLKNLMMVFWGVFSLPRNSKPNILFSSFPLICTSSHFILEHYHRYAEEIHFSIYYDVRALRGNILY